MYLKVLTIMHKIAVVDDDENWGKVVKRYFQKEFEVDIFTTTSSFLKKVKLFDLVIVDLSIPQVSYEKNLDGRKLIKHLRENIINPPILVLATAFISNQETEIAKKVCPEADDFFAKDAGLEKILQRTKMLLASRKSEK